MVRENHYNNVITEEDLDAAGDGLYEIVHSDQILSNGRRMNETFLHLMDTDILVQKKQRSEEQIVFKYERFYEYFAGRRVVSLSEKQTDRKTFFLNLIGETTQKAFLWGAVRNALVKEALKPDSDTVQKLCKTGQQRTKEMIVSVLIIAGMDDRKRVEEILQSLILPEKKTTGLNKLRQLRGKTEQIMDAQSRNAIKIAIEVASNLNVPWVLQSASLQSDATIRTTAVRYAYHLWQRDQVVGFEILEYVTKNATSGVIPNFTAIESALGLSALIFFEHSRDKLVLARLQNIWRKMIANVLRIREEKRRLQDTIRGFMREQIVSFVTRVAFRLFREFSDYNLVNYQGFQAFFQLGATEKALYRNLVQYIDVDGSYSREQMENDYISALKINNLLVGLVAQLGLIAHACHEPLAFLPFLKNLFEETKRTPATYPYLSDITNVVVSVLDFYPMIDEVFDFFVYAAEVCQDYSERYPQTARNESSKAPQAMYLSSYIFNQYRRAGTVRTAWLESRIQTALSQNNIPFFDLLLTTELPVVGIGAQEPRAALLALELFFDNDNEKISQMIQSFLSRLRVHYPDDVDDFLEEQLAHLQVDNPDEVNKIRLWVRTNEPAETVGELIGVKSWYFIRNDVIMNSPHLRSLLMRLFEKAVDCKKARVWTDYFIRETINLVYGGEALRQPIH